MAASMTERTTMVNHSAELDEPRSPLAAAPPGGGGLLAVAGLASIGAGVVHAAAIRMHIGHVVLSWLLGGVAITQLLVGLVTVLRASRTTVVLTVLVNCGAVVAWLLTRVVGVGWIDGLERAEVPGATDSVAAALAAVAVAVGVVGLRRGRDGVATVRLGIPAVAVGCVTVAAVFFGGGHVHDDAARGDDHAAAGWPRPFDPTEPIDLSGVAGVNDSQRQRAEALVRRTVDVLPEFADVTTIGARGFMSVGDAVSGFEHFVNLDYLFDDAFLDPHVPESLVYRVDADQRTLVSAMYVADPVPLDDPGLVGFAGPLMQWHTHPDLNVCVTDGPNGATLTGFGDADGQCPSGSVSAARFPMVHVWIAPHECGPFASLDGQAAGQAAVATADRVDRCQHDHQH
jgi:hypothetical protein